MDEMFFQFSSNSDPQNTIPQDEILDFVPMGGSSRGRQRRLLASEKRKDSHDDDDKKKSMHRDIERQRRQGMSTLCASLRTLLPLEYIKGKRAISDHMNGAVSYIKDLQKRIDELSAKRDELKKVSFDSTSSGFHQGTSSNESFPSTAVVRKSLDGVDVVVRTGHGAQALTLSRVVQLLLDEGLDAVNCISTRIDGGLIHTIRLEVNDLRGVDVPYLQKKVNEEISSLLELPS
ncbi:putative Basic helix-loop-helix DNA-binding superfamily protein [Hibiscus syriacus]|uniref:Basic helix-loop-helix DNA-binding superfamily protein n=1 Tax=Hibiscus syriacus TaxID=106335 RepID=A0A6A3C848_HIBSY|nr:transcription factor bHLH120-like [Hibiscus syriacus]KAE8724021.1 putative Basic helix-loop-helix DNA-binding superfamily protein [Hibiscus syriacus]